MLDKESVSRRSPLITVAVILALLAGSVGISRTITFAVQLGRKSPPDRLTVFLQHLPDIACQQSATGLVLGSSEIALGFSPDAFDTRLRERHHLTLISYNVGLYVANFSLFRLLTRRIGEHFMRCGRQAALSVVEFTPYLATKTAKHLSLKDPGQLAQMAQLIRPSDFFGFARRTPSEAATILGIRSQGSNVPGVATDSLKTWLFDPPSPRWWPGTPTPAPIPSVFEQKNDELNAALERIEGGPIAAWAPQWRGEHRVLFPETQSVVSSLRAMLGTREIMESTKQFQIESFDVLGLNFDESLIQDTIATLNSMKHVARHTYLTLAPRNVAWIQPSADALARLAVVLARIQRETGVPVIDLSTSPEFAADDFIDPTHLKSGEPQARFSRLLADRVAALIESEDSGF